MAGMVYVLIGTKKGAFILSSADRKSWASTEILFKGWNVMHLTADPRSGKLFAAVSHFVYGPGIHISDDLGATWRPADQQPILQPARPIEQIGAPEEDGESLIKIWHIQPAPKNQPGVILAGGEPACLFRSTDDGNTWSSVEGFNQLPHRKEWFPGNGGLCLHTILFDPTNEQRVFISISTGGVYRSDDGGTTWHPKNKNTRADFMPDPLPEYGQCVHKVAIHSSAPDTLFQQNHCGVYRSDDAGESWLDIGKDKLPSDFGFPILVHPKQPKTIFVIPEESGEFRFNLDGQLAIWKSEDAGENWKPITSGLPKAHVNILREGFASDNAETSGLYFGTNTGQVFCSTDDGESWNQIADYLPPIQSVETFTN